MRWQAWQTSQDTLKSVLSKGWEYTRADANKNAKKALQYGIRHCDTEGSLNRYMTALFFRNRTANNIRIYNGSVYLFSNTRLITVFKVPLKYVETVKNMEAERNAAV